jgi:hypothetical protein
MPRTFDLQGTKGRQALCWRSDEPAATIMGRWSKDVQTPNVGLGNVNDWRDSFAYCRSFLGLGNTMRRL